MQSTSIVRPSWLSLHRSSLLGVIAVSAAALAIGQAMREAPSHVIHVPLPILTPIPTVVTVPVTTPITLPPQDVHVTVESPAPAERPTKARTLAPMIDPTCIAPLVLREGDGVSPCDWDDGVPAISEDGTRIAVWTRVGEEDVAMRFIDTKTSRILRQERLVANGEMEDYAVKPEARARVRARIAALQKELDEGNFRSLIEPLRNNPMTFEPMPRELVVEYATYEPAVRLVDGATGVQIWRGEFDDDEHCAQKLGNVGAWWDPSTRIVFVEVGYGKSEECPAHEHHYVQHAPERSEVR